MPSPRLQWPSESAKVVKRRGIKSGIWRFEGHPASLPTAAAQGTDDSGPDVGRGVPGDSRAGPTPEEYVAHVGGDAKIVPAGELKLDGRKLLCGQRPTVLDNNLDDYGAAYPGFLILNPRLLNKVSTPVKMWIYAHECGHQFRGPDEETADCFAVQRGRRSGWLTPEGLEESAASSPPPRATPCTSRARTAARSCASATSTRASGRANEILMEAAVRGAQSPPPEGERPQPRPAATRPVSQPISARLRVRPQW